MARHGAQSRRKASDGIKLAFGELVPMLPPALRLPDSGCCPGQDEAGKPRRNVPTGVA